MGKDKRGISRGKCEICECEDFENLCNGILCDYCGHRPLEHERTQENVDLQEPVQKKPRLGQDLAQGTMGEIFCVAEKKNEESEQCPGEETATLKRKTDGHQETQEPLQMETKEAELVPSEDGVEMKGIPSPIRPLQAEADKLSSESVKFVVQKKGGKLIANCSMCVIDVSLGKVNQGLNMLKQHIATPKHKTNTAIAESRCSVVSKELQQLYDAIEAKFPNTFIFGKKEVICRSCKTSHAINQLCLIPNLTKHVNGSTHNRNAAQTNLSSTRNISSFFVRQPRDQAK